MFPKGGCLKSTFMWPIDGDLSLAVTSAGDGVEKLRFILAETKIHRLSRLLKKSLAFGDEA